MINIFFFLSFFFLGIRSPFYILVQENQYIYGSYLFFFFVLSSERAGHEINKDEDDFFFVFTYRQRGSNVTQLDKHIAADPAILLPF